jgi:hypothetical protein
MRHGAPMIKRRIRPTLAALALVVLLGACGNGGGSADGGPASLDSDAAASDDGDNGGGGEAASAQERGDAVLEYAQCMRDNGVDLPDPEIGEDGLVEIPDRMPDLAATGASPDTIAAAEAACQPILDAVNALGEQVDPQEAAEALDQMVAVTECMRAKGYDMSDPTVDEMGRVQQMTPLDQGASQEQVERLHADLEACGDEAGLDFTPPTTEGEA